MDLFTKLFGDLLVFVYHCFDRIVIHGYLSGLSRPEQVVYFFRHIVGAPVVSKELLSQRTADYQKWVEAFARNHHIPIEWAEKGVRKEDFVQPWLRRMVKKNAYGVYFIFYGLSYCTPSYVIEKTGPADLHRAFAEFLRPTRVPRICERRPSTAPTAHSHRLGLPADAFGGSCAARSYL
jgi:hypothetical protein